MKKFGSLVSSAATGWLGLVLLLSTFSVQAASVLLPCTGATTEIGGTVFADVNGNGTADDTDGFAEVIVNLFDADGNAFGPFLSDFNGEWLATGLTAGTEYRIEFTFPTRPDVIVAIAGDGHASEVQFATAGDCGVDFGVTFYPAFCQQAERLVATPCYVQDNNLTGPNISEIVIGAVPITFSSDNTTTTKANMTYAVPAPEMGTTYGVAYQEPTGQLFASSYLKRKAGFGPNADGTGTTTGGIYALTPHGTAILFADLNALGLDTGADPHPQTGDECTSTAFGETSEDACWFHDLNTFSQIGRISLGDLEMSPDFNELWTVNLNTRELVRITVGQPAVKPTAADVTSFDVSAIISGADPAGNGDYVPFALARNEDTGLMYLGVTGTAQTSQDRANLDAVVYEFDPADPVGTITEIFRFDLDYDRSASRLRNCQTSPGNTNFFCSSDWQPWSDVLTDEPYLAANGSLNPNYNQGELRFYIRSSGRKKEFIHNSPIFSDIEFTNDGKLLLGLRDRTADQFGDGVGDPSDFAGPFEHEAVSGGDILIAAPDGATPAAGYTLESGATVGTMTRTLTPPNENTGATGGEGPGGDEYFDDNNDLDQAPGDPYRVVNHVHDELSLGGIAYDPTNDEIIISSTNPTNSASSGGLQWFNVATGTQTDGVRYYGQDERFDFGKAAGLGDVEILCPLLPVQIGNYAWIDADEDGIQDPGELPVEGLLVSLYDSISGDLVAVTTTAADGSYYFTGESQANETWYNGYVALDPFTDYVVVFGYDGNADDGNYDPNSGLTDIDGTEYELTTAGIGDASSATPDASDSDAAVIAAAGRPYDGYPAAVVTTPSSGADWTIDAGFFLPVMCHTLESAGVNC
ncbi:MAG: SdrD B-like domain-containing protein, partial [Bacteroidota bacterium]